MVINICVRVSHLREKLLCRTRQCRCPGAHFTLEAASGPASPRVLRNEEVYLRYIYYGLTAASVPDQHDA